MVQVGQKVHSVLYGGHDGIIYRVEGEQRPETIKSLGCGCSVMGGNADMYIVFDNGSQSCIPEAILHGVQWRIYDEVATDEEIQDALRFAAETEKERRRKGEAEKLRLEQERDRISREFPQLIKVQDSKLGFYAVGAKNIKKELSQKSPGVVFSVKSDSYSGGCSLESKSAPATCWSCRGGCRADFEGAARFLVQNPLLVNFFGPILLYSFADFFRARGSAISCACCGFAAR